MQPIYWYCIEPMFPGTLVGYYISRNYNYNRAVTDTLSTLVDEHYVRTQNTHDLSH